MNWYKLNVIDSTKYSLCTDAEIFLNDENLKPDWVEQPAMFTEFHVRRKKKDLLLVIGESWTYGESLPSIATGIGKYDINSQLRNCFGAKMALAMGTDYYQYAVPGNCNFYMITELRRILNYVSTLGYETIYLCFQLTEPGREKAIQIKLEGHPLDYLYNKLTKMSFDEWFKKYDEIFFDEYNSIVKQYSNVKAVLWKNFCKSNFFREDYSFKIIKDSWIRVSARFFNVDLSMPKFYSIGWLATMQEEYGKLLTFDDADLLKQIDIIERSNDYVSTSPRHRHHPDEVSHNLWAQYLLLKTGWVDDI